MGEGRRAAGETQDVLRPKVGAQVRGSSSNLDGILRPLGTISMLADEDGGLLVVRRRRPHHILDYAIQGRLDGLTTLSAQDLRAGQQSDAQDFSAIDYGDGRRSRRAPG